MFGRTLKHHVSSCTTRACQKRCMRKDISDSATFAAIREISLKHAAPIVYTVATPSLSEDMTPLFTHRYASAMHTVYSYTFAKNASDIF